VEERGLPQALDLLRSQWKMVAIVAVHVFAGATFYAESLPARYDAEAVVAFSPRRGIDTNAVSVVVPKYVAYVNAATIVNDVARSVGVSPESLAAGVNAEATAESGNMTITVRLANPEDAASAANELTDAAITLSADDRLLRGDLVATAVAPNTPAAPPRRLLEAAALVVGLVLGLIVALILERIRPRVRPWDDLAGLTGHPVVGWIPSSSKLRKEPLQAYSDPSVGAAFRTLRTNLEPAITNDSNVVVVTSPNSGDGKTVIAALFAESLARLGQRVLLMDADLRRAGVAQTSGLDPSEGLASILRGESDFSRGLRPGWVDGLLVLPTAADEDAGDALAKHFSDVIEEAKKRFDIVVVDSPPVLGRDQARILAAQASGVLLVVRPHTAVNSVNEAVLTLDALHVPVLGVIGNRMGESRTTSTKA